MTKKDLEQEQKVNDAINTVAERKENEGEVYTTHSGIKLRFRPVGTYNLSEVMAEIPDPTPPMFEHPNSGEMLPNYHHPEYAEALHKARLTRSAAASDTMLIFGVQWLDDIPEEDDQWIEDLILTNRIPPQENPEDIPLRMKQLWYLKYMTPDYMEIIKRIQAMSSNPTEEGVAQARSTFQRTQGRSEDRDRESEEQG
jgi:hypothetical protein